MRLFIGIDIPEDIQKTIQEIQKNLESPFAGLRFTKDNHITLKFLGEVSEERLEYIKKYLKNTKFKPFELKTSQIGVFPNKQYIKVVWLGLQENKQLLNLQKSIDNALESYFPKEKNFIPHITLARVKFVKDKPSFVKKIENIQVPESSWQVSEFRLYRSILTPEGPEYTNLMSIP